MTDAQNKPVTVLGKRHAWIKIGDHVRKKFQIIIYQASHKEMLLGYAFLAQFRLAKYANVGIGTQPKLESVRRFKFHQEQLKCHTTKHEYVSSQAVKVVTTRINPETWSEIDRTKAIGCWIKNPLKCSITIKLNYHFYYTFTFNQTNI